MGRRYKATQSRGGAPHRVRGGIPQRAHLRGQRPPLASLLDRAQTPPATQAPEQPRPHSAAPLAFPREASGTARSCAELANSDDTPTLTAGPPMEFPAYQFAPAAGTVPEFGTRGSEGRSAGGHGVMSRESALINMLEI